ncbi:MAG: AraC family transcriptional regulator [Cyclobacteriaceae bacterium]
MPRNVREKEEFPILSFWDLSPDKVIHIEEVHANAGELGLFQPHHLGHFAIRWVVEGSGAILIDHIRYEIEPNMIFLATPSQISRTDIPQGTPFTVKLIAFHEELIPLMGFEKDAMALLTGLSSHWNIHVEGKNNEIIGNYYDLLKAEFDLGPRDRNPWILAAITKALILHLIRIHNKNAQDRRKPLQYQNLYREYLDSLEKNFMNTHYVSDYVEMLGTNEKQLNRACKAMTDHSARHIIDERLNFEAKRSLYYTRHTIKEISYHLGFKDPAHFVKFFKRKNNRTPGDYKSDLAKMEKIKRKKQKLNTQA